MKRSLLGYIVAGLVMVGCGGVEDPANGTGTGGKADDGQSVDGTSITLIQAGAFDGYGDAVPDFVRYGFTDDHAPGWEAAGEITVSYDSSHKSLPIVVTVPEDNQKRLLAFVIHADTVNRDYWGEDLFVDLSQPEGTLVTLPVFNYASYPFARSCYEIGVKNADDTTTATFSGMVTEVFFGFTDSTLAQYRANNDVPWQNLVGDYVAEGVLAASHGHNGGYKGTMLMYPLWVRVPQGKNAVFKLSFNKYDGGCYEDTGFAGAAQTQTYFVPVAE